MRLRNRTGSVRYVRPPIALSLFLFTLFACLPVCAQTGPDEKRIDDLISKLTLEEKIHMLSGSTVMSSTGVARLGIPAFRMSDGPMGAHIPPPSTAYAAGIGLAASWDRALATRVGAEIGNDARSRGVSFVLGPGVNIYRSPLNGRNFEYFGEDPFLAGETAAAYIRGVQSENVSAVIKHYAANNSEYFRNTSDSVVSERALREIYLPAFETAVKKGHVGSIMDSYNFINGEHATQNAHLNIEIAKQQWGFDGVMMSDWGATHDGIAAANAGLDLEMPFGQFMNEKTLVDAVKEGKIKESVIDDKIRRLLRVGYRFGWMSQDPLDPSISRYSQAGRQASLQGAREGIVLLKNGDGVLPLDPAKVRTVAVIGPDAYPGSPTAGGSGQVPTFYTVSALKGISDHVANSVNVLYDPGISRLSMMAMRSGFSQSADKFVPGVTIETFDNSQFSGKPVSTRTAMFSSAGSNILDNPDMGEMVNTVTADQMMAFMSQAGAPRYDRWTGYYFARSPGNFVIFVENQGQYRLSIDGQPAIDHSVIPRSALAQTRLTLAPGPHKFVLENLTPPDFGEAIIKIGVVQEGTFVHQSAIDLAKMADAAIVCVGYDAEIETEGADREFRLPPGQDELIEKIAAVNPRTIVVIAAGGSVDASQWIDKIAGLLQNWYPGQEGGTGLAEVLFGDFDPSGRLPITLDQPIMIPVGK